MVLYQSLQEVRKPYRGFNSFHDTLSFAAPRGSWAYESRRKGSDVKKDLETSITPKFLFRYEITARHIRILCNCTVGADAFDSGNTRNTFTQNLASSFRFPPTYAPVFFRPAEISLFAIA